MMKICQWKFTTRIVCKSAVRLVGKFPIRLLTLAALVLTISPHTQAARFQLPRLSIATYTATHKGFDVNSHLICGEHKCILVDAQFTKPEAEQVIRLLKSAKKRTRALFISQSDPDHYLGAVLIRKAFPKIKIISTQSIIDDIEKTAPEQIVHWKQIYKDELPTKFILPKVYKRSDLQMDGVAFNLLEFSDAENSHTAVLYIPSNKALLASDLIYSKVHLPLTHTRPEEWIRNLRKLKETFPIDSVYPGHGPIGGKELIDENIRYLEDFKNITHSEKNEVTAITEMKEKFPDFSFTRTLELSIAESLKPKTRAE